VSGSSAQPSLAPIEEIAIQRLCFACACPYKLTFRRDGTAARTIHGGAAHGTTDRICKGAVTQEDFAALAALMQRAGFFDLNESYRHPRLVDGHGATTSAVGGGRRKQVQNVNQAGPSNLKAIEDAIDALGTKVAWTEIWPLRW
jgi:hypothetical protein